MTALEKLVTDLFHVMYYSSDHTWNGGMTRYKGVPCLQNPMDMWNKQEVIHDTKPDLLVETGSACGGSALYYTDLFPKLEVISVDIQQEIKPLVAPKRVTFLKGKSTDPAIVAKVKAMAKGRRVMVILDSDHRTANVAAELKAYAPLVSRGCYLIVEDTNLDVPPLNHPDFIKNGPMKAVAEFMHGNKDFIIDVEREKFYLTFYPNGWLFRK